MISSLKTLSVDDTCVEHEQKFLKIFSIQENLKSLFTMENHDSENTFLSLNGLRFLFTLWMIIAHSNLYTFGAVDNLQFAFTSAGRILIQPIFSTFIAVETFFVLGGFFVSFNFFQSTKKTQKISFSLTTTRIIKRFIKYNIGFSIVSETRQIFNFHTYFCKFFDVVIRF